MPYYLAPFIGSGTVEDAFRVLASDQPGSGIIDLRPDSTQLAGRALLYLPVASAEAGLVKLAEAKFENLSPLIRNRIKNLLGADFPSTQFDRIVADLLVSPPVGTWKAIRPSIVRRQWEIWLGDLLWSMPTLAGGATLSDNFNRANENPLAAPWTNVVNSLYLISNIVGNPVTGVCTGRYESDLATANHFCQVSFQIGSAGDRWGGGAVRFAAAATTYYSGMLYDYNDTCRFDKFVTGTQTNIASTAFTVNASVWYVIKTQIDGSTYTVWVDGVSKLTGTDISIAGGTLGGISLYSPGSSSNWFDDWSAEDVAAAGGPPAGTLMMMGCGV